MIETQTMFVPTLFLAQDGKPPVIGGSSDSPASTGQLAAGEGADGSGTTTTTQAAPGAGSNMLIFGVLIFFAFLIISQMMQGRKEKRRKAELLSSIGRHDRVQTIGGIIGTVAEMTDDEVVLRVDESTNSRVRVSRASIQQVLKKGRGSSIEAEAKPEVETVS